MVSDDLDLVSDAPDDRESVAAKRPRLASPASSEESALAPMVGCVPCADQEEGINSDADDARPFACEQPGCDSRFKKSSGLKRHKAHKHGLGVVWHACDLCESRFKSAGHLKQHKADAHGLGVVWHACDQPGCEYQAKQAGTLKQHKANAHGLGVVWHACDQPGCEHQFKEAGDLKQHKANKHGLGVVWHACDQPGCEHQFKQACNLKQHKANAHGLGVVWHACDQPGCEHQFKQACNLKRHKANAHDLGVVWHACDQPGCEHQFKQASNLHEHTRTQHARVYAQRKKEQEERVRRALVDAGWQEHRLAEAMPPVGHFRREKRIDFRCAKLESRDTWCRIDFVLGVPHGFVFLEVDEGQHKYGYGDHLSCDMKRMACVMESLAVETNYNAPPIYWLRYNPNAWRVGGDSRRVPKADREANLAKWLGAFECVAPFGIGYAFYDCEAPDADDGAPGALDVLGNAEYNPHYADAAENLMDLASVHRS